MTDVLTMTIPGSDGVTVQELLDAFHDVLDGTQSHDIQSNTGLPDEDVERIIRVRESTSGQWSR